VSTQIPHSDTSPALPSDVSRIAALTEGIPHTIPERGYLIYDFVRQHGFKSVLELGFAHGVSSCYIAAALKANGEGFLTTIDLDAVRGLNPSIETLLERTGLRDWVKPVNTATSYTWELMHLIERTPAGEWAFDFAFIDGAHSWFVDGLAFFLVDRLLKPGGWILFDDLNWTFAKSRTLRESEMVRAMPVEEREMPQVGKVFELLVRTHPSYGEFRTDGLWGWARKVGA
jgi:predicted O-methyltransferase YrrM